MSDKKSKKRKKKKRKKEKKQLALANQNLVIIQADPLPPGGSRDAFELSFVELCWDMQWRTGGLLYTLEQLRRYLSIGRVDAAMDLVERSLYELREVSDPKTDQSDRYVCLFDPDEGGYYFFDTAAGAFTTTPCI